jgi:hypothetical protein
MNYRKASWRDVVDPAFDGFIEIYLWALRRTHLPSNEGFLSLALEEDELRKMESAHFPGISFLYEKKNIDHGFISELGSMIGFDVSKSDLNVMREVGKSVTGLYVLFSSAAEFFEDRSKEYYCNAFDFLSSDEKYKKYFLDAEVKHRVKIKKKYESDVLSWMVHCFKVGLDELREEAKTEDMRKFLRNKIMGVSSLARRSIFLTWDNISLLVHKKSLKQLYAEAKKGNGRSLFQLLQVDKTLFDHDWVRSRIRKAAYTGDWGFFYSLSEAVKRDPLANRRIHGDVLMVLLTLWKVGLYRLTVPQLMQLLKDSGVRMKYDEVNFRTFVNREIKPHFKDW